MTMPYRAAAPARSAGSRADADWETFRLVALEAYLEPFAMMLEAPVLELPEAIADLPTPQPRGATEPPDAAAVPLVAPDVLAS